MRYHDSLFTAAHAAGLRTARDVAAHVGCSLATAKRRMVRGDTPEQVRAKLARIAGHIGVAVRLMDWEDGDGYVSACWQRERNPLRRVG